MRLHEGQDGWIVAEEEQHEFHSSKIIRKVQAEESMNIPELELEPVQKHIRIRWDSVLQS
jgi:hypothetical protein